MIVKRMLVDVPSDARTARVLVKSLKPAGTPGGIVGLLLKGRPIPTSDEPDPWSSRPGVLLDIRFFDAFEGNSLDMAFPLKSAGLVPGELCECLVERVRVREDCIPILS